jgi:hypothetical protein
MCPLLKWHRSIDANVGFIAIQCFPFGFLGDGGTVRFDGYVCCLFQGKRRHSLAIASLRIQTNVENKADFGEVSPER